MSQSATKRRVFSGIQPTGSVHLGNYLGAIKNWVDSQDDYENVFCLVDLHAITVRHDPETLHRNTRELAGILLAAGIDPEKSCLFVQSAVAEHAELAWIMSCMTPMGQMERMTQFKEKSEVLKGRVSVGLFTYPALMAADILLYQTDLVPVGEDQKQHIELTRDIAQRFNATFGETFTMPEPLIRPVAARIMGLDDPTKKMSKSVDAPNHAIGLLEPPKRIAKKIRSATTDSGSDVCFDPERPGLLNLLTIYRALTGLEPAAIEARYAGRGYGHLKVDLAEIVVEALRPLQERYRELVADPGWLDARLAEGAERVRPIAVRTMALVKERLGLG
jgi:tryptophanyl-tRNA synthetase